MGNLTTALIIVLMINAFLVLGQMAIMDINPNADNFLNASKTPLYSFANDGVLDDSNINDQLPNADAGISPTTGNVFTDTWNAVKTWFLDTTGINYLLGLLSAPYNFLKAITGGAFPGFVLVVGSLWYIMTLYLIINFLKGGGGD